MEKEVTIDIPNTNADYDHLQKMFMGFQATMAVEMACQLKVFDGIAKNPDGGSTVDWLITWGGNWDRDATERLLNTLTAVGVLNKDKDVYKLNGPGRLLVSTERSSVAGMFGWRDMLTQCYTGLVPTIKKEKRESVFKTNTEEHRDLRGHDPHSHDQHGHDLHGHNQHEGAQSGDDVWDPDQVHSFCGQEAVEMYRAMDGELMCSIGSLLTAFDLSHYRTAVDLGAGSGAVSFELARLYPSMKVTLFEVPAIIKMVKENFIPAEGAPNVTFVGGDFYKDDLPKSDIFIISKIVHDVNDDQRNTLFKRILQFMNPGGALILVEKLLNDDKTGPAIANLFDLWQIQDQLGRQRTLTEYTDLLTPHGFTRVRAARTNGFSMQDIIIATME